MKAFTLGAGWVHADPFGGQKASELKPDTEQQKPAMWGLKEECPRDKKAGPRSRVGPGSPCLRDRKSTGLPAGEERWD